MGQYSTAYAAYGVRVTDPPYDEENDRDPEQTVDHVLNQPDVKAACPDVGHLTTGPYDHPTSFFLTTECKSAEPGEHDAFEPGSAQERQWAAQLARAVEALGWGDHVTDMPHWFVTCDID